MVDVNVCPSCTEFVQTPLPISDIGSKSFKAGYRKYKCQRCGIEFEYKVTKDPDYNNWGNHSEDVMLGRR